ncbi:hypothetical protein QVD17_28839 [Tagetes erecta]|uniref:DUF659 domain-containing protein n=1 Tax=Tagetes erecta TaxID=13708 RepID=A0AAD8KB72_TARER|nr:hypothetical protein QVD17_28839 [Tagetes erecta]
MAFGKRVSTQQEEDNETHISDTQGAVDVDDVVETNAPSASQATRSSGSRSREKGSEEKDANKPLIIGEKTDIKRCTVVLRDRALYDMLLKKVKDAENYGVSKCLKISVLSKNGASKKRLEESFAILERKEVDLKIIRGLCANGIPFNVLRNPHFIEMISAIQKAPDGYKPPSCENARTMLLDLCVHDVEKELAPVKDTWYTQGVSIVSDGWSNVKHKPLINVLAVNSRGAMFMEAQDFSRVVKTGEEIASYLIGAIKKVGASNVLQVVTDNAANCKKAGEEIEKSGPTKKWDMNPENSYIEGSSSRLEEMLWEDLEYGDDNNNNNDDKGKRQRVD